MDLVDDRIRQHKLGIHNLNTERNSLASISRLPSEVLASIFILLACDHFERHCRTWFSDSGVPDWINVTYVSSHWRNVALNCPPLWSYIVTAPERWIQILLQRSKQALLRIHIEAENKMNFWLLVWCLKHAERVEELHLCMHWWWKDVYKTFAMLCSHAPHLQTLEFSFKEDIHDESAVSIDGCVVDLWHSLKLHRGLTTLKLYSMPLPLKQDIWDLRAALDCMPDLRHLHLQEALTSADDFSTSTKSNDLERVNMSRLMQLSIVAPLSTIIAFLSIVHVTGHAEIKLEYTLADDIPPESHEQLCSVLAQNYRDGHMSTSGTSCSLVMKFEFNQVVLAFRSSPECDYEPSDHHSLIGIETPVKWGHNTPLEIIIKASSSQDILAGNICASVPTKSVQTLHIIDPPPSHTFWRKTLGHLEGLRHIKLKAGCMALGLISALRPQTADDSLEENQHQGQILVPRLDELELVDMEFMEHEVGSCSGVSSDLDSEVHDDGPSTDVQSLYETLSTRKETRGRLSMFNCDTGYVYLSMIGRWEDGHFHVDNCEQRHKDHDG